MLSVSDKEKESDPKNRHVLVRGWIVGKTNYGGKFGECIPEQIPFKSDANHSSISLRVNTFGFIVWASQKIKEKGAQPCSQGLFPISKGKALGAKLRGPLFLS